MNVTVKLVCQNRAAKVEVINPISSPLDAHGRPVHIIIIIIIIISPGIELFAKKARVARLRFCGKKAPHRAAHFPPPPRRKTPRLAMTMTMTMISVSDCVCATVSACAHCLFNGCQGAQGA
jgi:hypothetical protein